MKIIPYYLPQFHQIPENDLWWGNGFTEWDTLKRGKKTVEGQYQPRIPLDNNYYNLMNIDVMRWQAEMAKKYNVFAFSVYQYWFNGKLLLEKPMEQLLNSDIDFPFFFCWANEKWTTIWEGQENPKTLISHNYTSKSDWDDHFSYCIKFFKDDRYIKEDNMPIYSIYNPVVIHYCDLQRFMKRWNELARENGFAGIKFICQSPISLTGMTEKQKALFDYLIVSSPWIIDYKNSNRKTYIQKQFGMYIKKLKSLVGLSAKTGEKGISAFEYKDVWNQILSYVPHDKREIPGAFTDWDNTPRHQTDGRTMINASPELFKEHLKEQIKRAKDVFHKDVIMMFAWNEWSEGGYLEPDSKYGYSYLEALNKALIETDEVPEQYAEGMNIFTK